MNTFHIDPDALVEMWKNAVSFADFKSPSDYEDIMASIMEGAIVGDKLSFDNRMQFLPGEVTLWCGASGHGKSLLTGQIALSLAMQQKRVLIMSLEMTPQQTLLRMLRQTIGHAPKDARALPIWFDFLDKYIHIFDYVGRIEPDQVYGAILYAAENLKVQHIFIDNMMKIVAGEDTYNEQKDFVNYLCMLSKRTGAHIHLVHHLKKQSKETDDIDGYSIRGSQAIKDQVDNVILVKRNVQKEKRKDEAEQKHQEMDSASKSEPDSFLKVDKQRNGDFTGTVPLYFDNRGNVFCKENGKPPLLAPNEIMNILRTM